MAGAAVDPDLNYSPAEQGDKEGVWDGTALPPSIRAAVDRANIYPTNDLTDPVHGGALMGIGVTLILGTLKAWTVGCHFVEIFCGKANLWK
eukprot:5391477-Pyramimonas_sp.AAC.1